LAILPAVTSGDPLLSRELPENVAIHPRWGPFVEFSGISIISLRISDQHFPGVTSRFRQDDPMTTSRILIADDNQPNCELLEAYLAEVECDVDMAFDGQDTLSKVKSFRPDLILLDVMMPKLSGFEVCRKLKDDAATRSIMILMVTALNELGDIERAVEAGTDDFLSKPVNKVELIKRVQNMLKLKGISDENDRLRQYIEQMEET
jgi:PleD family two-component response regulator